jgi:fructose-1,6-bisphosphatase/inositol monophosphatase family enzyme
MLNRHEVVAMSFDPHLSTRVGIAEYFAARAERFPNLLARVEEFFASPSLETGKQLLRAYFRHHTVGDIASLRMATAAFADKRLVRSVVESILNDEAALAGIASRSYPHPIGFDKLVLDDDRETGFKFRLHVYWRGANFASLERLHLHRFEMASAIVTGELTNHIWRVVDFKPRNGLVKGMVLARPGAATGQAHEWATAYAYAGYRRDANGDLRKTYLGEAALEPGPSDTFTSGDSYAQILEDAHFVETNAETGLANGDFCSTVYIHGPSLTDFYGRALPILFEKERLADNNALVNTIPPIPVDALRTCLIRYRDALDEILKYYDWLYHPKHGRDLSVGMVAGYLLCESFKTPHAIDAFERRYEECKEVLNHHEHALRQLIEAGTATGLSEDDRKWRYVRLLLAKANSYPRGPELWLEDFGNLTKEMWRYFGAIRGEVNTRITVLKPIWERVVQRKLPGGMHYGHVGAMIEAAFDANAIGAKHFETHLLAVHKDEHNVTSIVDGEIESRIREVLKSHFPTYRFYGEEGGDADHSAPEIGAKRFLVDPLDGTRNFLGRRQEFCTSIACQEWDGVRWVTTDGVVAHPASGRIFWAERGHGAFVIERNDYEHRAAVQTLAVDNTNPLRHQLIDYSARGLDLECQVDVFRELVSRNAAIRNSGSVALILACMAGGGGSGTILTANDYDVEAGLLIAREAGASITQIEFVPEVGTRIATVVGADPRVHDALVLLLKGMLERHGKPVTREAAQK